MKSEVSSVLGKILSRLIQLWMFECLMVLVFVTGDQINLYDSWY